MHFLACKPFVCMPARITVTFMKEGNTIKLMWVLKERAESEVNKDKEA